MKIILKTFFIFIIFSEINITNTKNITPLSECLKSRIIKYTGWENGGKFGFVSYKNSNGISYIYPASPNSDLFISSSHCGI